MRCLEIDFFVCVRLDACVFCLQFCCMLPFPLCLTLLSCVCIVQSEPLINGVDRLKYIDDSTDDEYVNSFRDRLLPSRSPASKLGNVVEETPPTSPSFSQQSGPGWSASQSKPGASNGHTRGTAPRQTSVSSQGPFTTDIVKSLPKPANGKHDGDRRVGLKKAASDEDIEC